MSNTGPTITPRLNFSGNTAEAMKFYHGILGGELTMQTFVEANKSKSPKTGTGLITRR
ncbi:MAG: hypothetical protein OK404_02730 [Thaumarchaeota archaeon]|nr:hypothetical protein [Nitrososphaerota archaeon]